MATPAAISPDDIAKLLASPAWTQAINSGPLTAEDLVGVIRPRSDMPTSYSSKDVMTETVTTSSAASVTPEQLKAALDSINNRKFHTGGPVAPKMYSFERERYRYSDEPEYTGLRLDEPVKVYQDVICRYDMLPSRYVKTYSIVETRKAMEDALKKRRQEIEQFYKDDDQAGIF